MKMSNAPKGWCTVKPYWTIRATGMGGKAVFSSKYITKWAAIRDAKFLSDNYQDYSYLIILYNGKEVGYINRKAKYFNRRSY